ncbi:MAG: hypothetical protein DRJ44_03580 [Thermoprotei archaeon]|nr:MAG: hypothetical protein DRJ44_03580 [Thermoprotei archaeon]
MYPKKPKPKRIVAIPSNLFLKNHLREKTLRIGLLARAFAVFRVEEVIIYKISGVNDEANINIIKKILEYLECPQYIRSRLFKKDPVLKYAGILPPLRTPHHPLKNEKTTYREGVVIRRRRNYVLVDVGLESPVKVFAKKRIRDGERVSIVISYDSQGNVKKAEIVERDNIGIYWGYTVEISKSLTRTIKESGADLVVATSRKGDLIQDISQRFIEKMHDARKLILLFGSQKEGLFEIAKREGRKLPDISDLIINFVPYQGTKTVRTEEAIFATLSIVNYLNTLM